MANIATATGAKVYISSTSITESTDTTGEFAALTWTEIGLVQSFSAYGDSSSVVKFASLSDGRNRVAKGIRDAGEMTLTVARAPDDAGQQALVAAELLTTKYGFKIVLPNRLTTLGTDEINYFRGLVTGKRNGNGQNDQVLMRDFVIAIDSPIYETAAT